jgi:hypothetical protein
MGGPVKNVAWPPAGTAEVHTLDADARYQVDGHVRTGNNIQKALECAKALAWAFERAAKENGGNGSVRWADVDAANRHAIDAMGVTGLAGIISEAMAENKAKRGA